NGHGQSGSLEKEFRGSRPSRRNRYERAVQGPRPGICHRPGSRGRCPGASWQKRAGCRRPACREASTANRELGAEIRELGAIATRSSPAPSTVPDQVQVKITKAVSDESWSCGALPSTGPASSNIRDRPSRAFRKRSAWGRCHERGKLKPPPLK